MLQDLQVSPSREPAAAPIALRDRVKAKGLILDYFVRAYFSVLKSMIQAFSHLYTHHRRQRLSRFFSLSQVTYLQAQNKMIFYKELSNEIMLQNVKFVVQIKPLQAYGHHLGQLFVAVHVQCYCPLTITLEEVHTKVLNRQHFARSDNQKQSFGLQHIWHEGGTKEMFSSQHLIHSPLQTDSRPSRVHASVLSYKTRK